MRARRGRPDLDPIERRRRPPRFRSRSTGGVAAMTPVTLTVNGKQVAAMIEPRTHLRTSCASSALTGTHLGCEHGVCGACTVLINGEPALAPVSPLCRRLDGQDVRTIEGWRTTRSCSVAQAFTREARCNAGSVPEC